MIKASYSKRTLIFKQPAGTSRGVLKQKEVYYLLLNETGNSSSKGIGEIAPIPGLSPDAVPQLEEKIKNLVKKINHDKRIGEIEFEGFPAIRFGYETALIGLNTESQVLLFPSDFTARKTGIPINGLIWMGSKEFMLQQVEEKLTDGFTCLKLKIGAIDFKSELDILQLIRKRYPAEQLEIRVDANGAFSAESAPSILKELSSLRLHSIEQPIRPGQFEMMKKLCAEAKLPIALDEELIGIVRRSDKVKLLEQIRPQYIILKPTLLGGIKSCEEWIELSEERGIGWWVTSALESNIGLNAIAQWTATLGSTRFQGLGTGALFINNIESPLYVSKGVLWFDPTREWDFNSIVV